MVKKAIKANAKVSLLLSLFVRDIDQRCPQGNCPATLTKSQTSSAWDPRDEPSKKAQNPKLSHSSRSENSETSDPKAWKEKKKKYCRKQAQKDSGSTPATSINITEANEGARKQWARSATIIAPKRDIIQEIIPNLERTRQKTSNGLGNLHVNDWG